MSGRIYYLRDQNNVQVRANGFRTRGNPVAIVVSRVDRVNGQIHYGFAAVHPKDCFVKTRARQIASGRLEDTTSKYHYTIDVADIPNTGHEISRIILSDIAENDFLYNGAPEIPNRVRRLAKQWVDNSLAPRAEVK